MDYHIPIMRDEVIKGLAIRENGMYVDGTLGGGGHTEAILSANETCRVIGIDRDAEAIEYAGKRLKKFGGRFTSVRDNFKNLDAILKSLNIDKIDGALLDLGISSRQIDERARGFSYMGEAELDMRMDTRQHLTAAEVVNGYTEAELGRVIREYGEEDFYKRIASAIIRERAINPVTTTKRLSEIITNAVPMKFRFNGHPAKKTFQAIRIEVNGELEGLKEAIEAYVEKLNDGGRMCVITFHSLEDRIVKNVFKEKAAGCICDKSFPVCVCGHKPEIKTITNKPLVAGKDELEKNSRAASAKLRIIERTVTTQW